MNLFENLDDEMEQRFYEWMEDNYVEVADLTNWPLDDRAKPRIAWVNKELFVVPSENIQRIDYYGGLEYCDNEHRKTFGKFVVFSAESSRIQNIIDAILGEDEEEREEEI